jgi:hypothetical protein
VAIQVLSIIEIPYFRELENGELLDAIISSGLLLIGIVWAFGNHIRKQTIVPVALFPVFFMFVLSLFLGIGVLQDIVRVRDRTISLAILLITGIGLYILLLTTNILAVSYYKAIPLARAARASSYVFTLIGAYFTLLILINLNFPTAIKALGVFISLSYLGFSNLWHLNAGFKENIQQSVSIAAVVTAIFLSLSLWPIPAQFFALVITLFLYMFFGLALEQKASIGKAVWIEYSLLVAFITFILLSTSVWGINGTFLGI